MTLQPHQRCPVHPLVRVVTEEEKLKLELTLTVFYTRVYAINRSYTPKDVWYTTPQTRKEMKQEADK